MFCCRPGDGTGDWFWRSSRGEDLLSADLLPWQEGPLGYKWVPTGVGGKGKAMSEGGRLGGGDMWDPQQMGAGGQGRLPQVFCWGSGGETDGLSLEEQRER